ncbi:unnamed protein product [Camellia sinensis]
MGHPQLGLVIHSTSTLAFLSSIPPVPLLQNKFKIINLNENDDVTSFG